MSDHFSGPAVMGDPAVDITDFFAFPSPERPGNLVLIMDAFPLATAQSFFSDVVTYRFRLRPLGTADGRFIPGSAEFTIDFCFSDMSNGSEQKATVITSDGRQASFALGTPFEQDGMRAFAGLVSDPFFMDVEAALRTEMAGKLSFDTAVNTVHYRDVLSIVAEIPFAPILQRFDNTTLIGAIAEDVVTRRGKPIRIERLGRPEIKNFVLGNPTRDPRTMGIELRDLYNREDAFALSNEYGRLYASRIDANLAFFDGLDGRTDWPLGPDGRHPLRDLFNGDFLVLDAAKRFAPGGFLEIEKCVMEGRPHQTSGGRWLDDDILDVMLSLFVNGGHGDQLGDGVDGPSKPASLTFPYVREPNNRTDLPLPAFLRG